MNTSKISARHDFKTNQYIPVVNGKDCSPTSFSKERAIDIATQIYLDSLTIKAKVTISFDFTESLKILNQQRIDDGEEPMDQDEIKEWVEDEITDCNLNEYVNSENIDVEISE